MLSRRAYMMLWAVGIGAPLTLVLWALVPDLQPSWANFLYHPGLWWREVGLLCAAFIISLTLGYLFGRARWIGRHRA